MSSILEHRAEREEGRGERDRQRETEIDRDRETERKDSRPTLNKPHQELC